MSEKGEEKQKQLCYILGKCRGDDITSGAYNINSNFEWKVL